MLAVGCILGGNKGRAVAISPPLCAVDGPAPLRTFLTEFRGVLPMASGDSPDLKSVSPVLRHTLPADVAPRRLLRASSHAATAPPTPPPLRPPYLSEPLSDHFFYLTTGHSSEHTGGRSPSPLGARSSELTAEDRTAPSAGLERRPSPALSALIEPARLGDQRAPPPTGTDRAGGGCVAGRRAAQSHPAPSR